MTNDSFEYDVAVSFAEADRATAADLADRLAGKKISIFLDEYKSPHPGGKDILDHLVNLYARKTRYCVLLISSDYPLKAWTETERRSARERALRDADEFILLLRLDDTEVPGITEAAGYRDLRQHSLEGIVELLEQKLGEINRRSGQPPKSHDLRSGNVPQ